MFSYNIKAQILIQLAIQLSLFRCIIRLLDSENSKEYNEKKGKWVAIILLSYTVSRFCIEQYFYSCMVQTIIGKLVGLIFIVIGISTLVFNGSIRLELLGETTFKVQLILYLLCFVIGLVWWLHLLNQSNTDQMKYLLEINKKILVSSENNYIVNQLEESIIIVN